MKNASKNTPVKDYEAYTLERQIKELRERNRALEVENTRLLSDIEHLNNLSIPHVSKELGRSIHRSVKFRVTRAIWGKEHYYQSDEAMLRFVKPISQLEEANEALAIIKENDARNVLLLHNEPSRNKVVVYETVRKLSHAPRRAKKIIKRKISG